MSSTIWIKKKSAHRQPPGGAPGHPDAAFRDFSKSPCRQVAVFPEHAAGAAGRDKFLRISRSFGQLAGNHPGARRAIWTQLPVLLRIVLQTGGHISGACRHSRSRQLLTRAFSNSPAFTPCHAGRSCQRQSFSCL